MINILATILLAGCDKDPVDTLVYEKDFCTRYHESFLACDCFFDPASGNDGPGGYGDGALYKSGRKIRNNDDAEAFFNRWLFLIQKDYYDTTKIKKDTRIECKDLGYGFYNCFVFNELYVTVSDDGDIYKTVCME
ncbi:diguanylate cyclase [Desulfovibrio ferrophilus]|uniref:Diguanylate cyclase n=2 Tax=Desulfovibrio ferrophilus TaxID=241368 RepID=A0A2Z6AWW5_9BACT|nr:diguanylate cyclase [Desulfovibrio ferrophilus]